jgi:hypothetical protein
MVFSFGMIRHFHLEVKELYATTKSEILKSNQAERQIMCFSDSPCGHDTRRVKALANEEHIQRNFQKLDQGNGYAETSFLGLCNF